jgi:fructose-bisphosphate aldolase class 1
MVLHKTIASPGCGIFESNGTYESRIASIGLGNTKINQPFREWLLTTPGLEYIFGSILFEETLYKSTDGNKFVDCLCEHKFVADIDMVLTQVLFHCAYVVLFLD